jgi:hypothetical protein
MRKYKQDPLWHRISRKLDDTPALERVNLDFGDYNIDLEFGFDHDSGETDGGVPRDSQVDIHSTKVLRATKHSGQPVVGADLEKLDGQVESEAGIRGSSLHDHLSQYVSEVMSEAKENDDASVADAEETRINP